MRPNKFPFFSFAALGNRLRRKGVASPRTPVWDQEFLVAIGGGDDDASDYAANAVAYRCVKLVAESAASERPDVVVRRGRTNPSPLKATAPSRHERRRKLRPSRRRHRPICYEDPPQTSPERNSSKPSTPIYNSEETPTSEPYQSPARSENSIRSDPRDAESSEETTEDPEPSSTPPPGRDDAFNLNAAEPEVLHLKSLNPETTSTESLPCTPREKPSPYTTQPTHEQITPR